MRKIWLVVVILFSLGMFFSSSLGIKKIKLKLDDEIGIVFINQHMLLVVGEDESTLLVLDKGNIDNLSKFDYRHLNVIMLKPDLIEIEHDKKIILEDDYEIDDVYYRRVDGLIYIGYKGTNMCVYTGGNYNISGCQFVYFYNPKVSNLTVYDYNEVVFYYYKNPLSKKNLEDIYSQSVGAYQIREDELIIVKLGEEDYDIIVIDNE